MVEAHSGAMGGSQSHEFMVASDAGEDFVVRCRKCGYAANLEKAVAQRQRARGARSGRRSRARGVPHAGPQDHRRSGRVHGLPETSQMKSLVMVADGKPVLVLLRGDHQLSETKFARRAAGDADVSSRASGGDSRSGSAPTPGSLGPVGVTKMRILADRALEGRRNMIAGANKDDYHLRHVTPGEDFQAEFHDLRQVEAGDACIACGAPVEIRKTVEIGHIFKLGYKYSESMGLRVLERRGRRSHAHHGIYGIGIERILSAAIELYHDKDGMSLPAAIAPFTVVVTPVNNADAAQAKAARGDLRACLELGMDALLDDRDERPGVKFKDADLIGVPFRVTVGKKVARGWWNWWSGARKQTVDVPVEEAAGAAGKGDADDWIGTQIRGEFPALEEWTYLNTATFGQMPRCAAEARG